MSRVAVIGGGAAGMMAAVAAANAGHQVTLFEHNEKLGKKLYITGKGRCNLTNACPTEELFDAFSKNKKFLYSAVYQFDNRAVMDFFESHGLRLKVERGNRVFPASDHSSDVIKALSEALRKAGVKVCLHADVTELLVSDLGEIDVDGSVHAKVDSNCDKSRLKNVKKEHAFTDRNVESGNSFQNQGSSKQEGTLPRKAPAGYRMTGLKYILNQKDAKDGAKEQQFSCDAVIIATGGVSYASTGSDGSGFDLLKPFGHTRTALRPSLIGMHTKESYIPELQGLTLKNISFTVKSGKKTLYKEFGELLFTHQGISGPVVLTASSVIPDKYFPSAEFSLKDYVQNGKKNYLRNYAENTAGNYDITMDNTSVSPMVVSDASDMMRNGCEASEKNHKKIANDLSFEIDLKAALTEEQLDHRIQRDFSENINRQFKNSLGKLLPSKLVPVIIRLSGIDPEKKVNSISKAERQELVHVLKHFPGTITGLGDMNEAIITRGGVPVKEVDPSTMESKLVRGLYICGEMLDVDAVTGGFNLQIAWSTGHLAGNSVE